MGDEDNKKVNAQLAVGHEFAPTEVSWNSKDCIIYALGIGSHDLRFIYELDGDFAAFPTYPVAASFKGTETDVISFPPPSMMMLPPGIPMINPAMILHGEQYLEVMKPNAIPTEGTFKAVSRVLGLHDRGKGALQEIETTIYDNKNVAICKLVNGAFIRGLSGFKSAGGTRSMEVPVPKRPADKVVEEQTSPYQAHIYRLSGDYNPLHIDPETATSVNFKEPILHGLASFGFAARACLREFAGNDPARFRAIKVRFSSPVYPGETLVTSMWKEGDRIIFNCSVKERGIVVLNNSFVDLFPASKL